MKKKNTIPKFNSYKEEASFWDNHSFMDYWDELEDANVVYAPQKDERKELITLRIDPSLKKKIKKIANEYDLTASSLIRAWIVGKVRDSETK